MFGAHPGPYGWYGAVIIFLGTIAAIDHWQDRRREQCAKLLEDNQRTINDPTDQATLRQACSAATTVTGLWPDLSACSGAVEPVLHMGIWRLAVALVERRKLAELLDTSRVAARGVPNGGPTAKNLALDQGRAAAAHDQYDAEIEMRLGRLTSFAAACQVLRNCQDAIRQAQQVARTADALLGPLDHSRQAAADDSGELAERVSTVLRAYQALASDIPR